MGKSVFFPGYCFLRKFFSQFGGRNFQILRRKFSNLPELVPDLPNEIFSTLLALNRFKKSLVVGGCVGESSPPPHHLR